MKSFELNLQIYKVPLVATAIWRPYCQVSNGGPVHDAPAIAGSGEGSMYVALPLHAERLFL